MDNADRLLARLHQENIRPIPRSVILLRRASLLGLLVLSVAASSISLALLFQEIFPREGKGWHFRVALSQAAPWIWSLSALLLVWAGIRIFRSLPRGWRVRTFPLGAGFAAASIVLAFAIFQSDALLGTHRFIAHRFPSYRAAWMRHVGDMKGECKKDENSTKDSGECGRNQR